MVKIVVFVVVVSRDVYVVVKVAVPPFRMLLQKSSASEVCPSKASSPHLLTRTLSASCPSGNFFLTHGREDHWGRP